MASTQSKTLLDLLQPTPGDRAAVVLPEQGITVTYASLRQQVEDVANRFVAAGIRPGDRVAMALPNGLPAIVCFLGASVAGTASPLNPGYREEEFRFFLEDTDARLLVLPPNAGEEARRAAGDRVPVVTAWHDSTGLMDLSVAANRHTASAPSPADKALVLHTSGSTGKPKRVPLRHANLTASVSNIRDTYALTPDDVTLCVMPLFHVHGIVASLLGTLASGGTVIVPSRFNPLGFWRIVRDRRVTWFSAVPTLHQLLLARGSGDPADRPSLRFIRSCSAALLPDTMHALEGAFGVPVLEAYGMTEASHQMASNPLPPRDRKAGSVGPATGVGISVMDADGGHLPTGQHGEVVIQGPNVTDGYENNPEANAASFTDGWFRTGDQGFLDPNGYLTLVARIKELINRGGEKISPSAIDAVLMKHPSVAEAVAFGVPHRVWGEEVAAAVVLRENTSASEADLLSFCREHLADFECPKKIHLTPTIPRTATGKIQRRNVAAACAEKSA